MDDTSGTIAPSGTDGADAGSTRRWFIQRCNGAEPGVLVDETDARRALQRAAERGHEVSGDLNSSTACWVNKALKREFTYSEASAPLAPTPPTCHNGR